MMDLLLTICGISVLTLVTTLMLAGTVFISVQGFKWLRSQWRGF